MERLVRALELQPAEVAGCVEHLGQSPELTALAQTTYPAPESTPAQQRDQTLAVLLRLVGLRASNKPLLVVLEDAHWSDPTTMALTRALTECITDHRVLLLMTTRPSFVPNLTDVEQVYSIKLEALGFDAITSIITHIAGSGGLTSDLLTTLAAKCDGVPLFAEELTKTLLYARHSQVGRQATLNTTELESLPIPESLQDSLVARLDRMHAIKPIAQAAACIGRDFTAPLLARLLAVSEDELQSALDTLVAADIVQPVHNRANSYQFNHALVRDAAYASLLKSRRRTLHGTLYKSLQHETNPADAILAHHAAEAAMPAAATDHWEAAGSTAASRAAYAEALGHFDRALQSAQRLEPQEIADLRALDILVQQGHTSTALNGFAHAKTVSVNVTAVELLGRVPETPFRFPLLYGNWVINHASGQHETALTAARNMHAEAQRSGLRLQEMIAARVLGATQTMMGEFSDAIENFESFHQLHDEELDSQLAWQYSTDPAVTTFAYHVMCLVCCGQIDSANKLIARLDDYSQNLEHLNSRMYALSHLSLVGQAGGLLGRKTYIDSADAMASEQGLSAYRGHTLGTKAMWEFENGSHSTAMANMNEALTIVRETNTVIYTPLLYAAHALALSVSGDNRRAKESAATAMRIVTENREHWAHAEVLRLNSLALIEATNSDTHNVERVIAGLTDAIVVAKRQRAHLWWLRSALSLTELLHEEGRDDEAREVLQRALADYPTDGHSAAEFPAANRLLAELT